MQDDRRVLGQIVGEDGGFFKKQRQVILYTGRCDTVADIFVEARARGVAFHARAEVATEHRLTVFVERKLARR